MKDMIYHYSPDCPHFDDYRVGVGCPPPPHPRHCDPRNHPYHNSKVGIVGKLVLSVKYVDHHGHVKYFDIIEGETYVIEAISQTKGKCRFAGRIVDFESNKGTEKILEAPHMINISSIIVDYSDNYESKLIRIGVDNIISITPINRIEEEPPCEFHDEEYFIQDPFADQRLHYAVEKAEEEQTTEDSTVIPTY